MYIDLLTKIKNAQKAKLSILKVAYSRMDFAIAELLVAHKYIESAEKKGRMPKRIIDIKIKYNEGGGAINGVTFLSKPSRRLYSGYKNLKSALQGHGLLVLSTPSGIASAEEAKKQKTGGVLLFKIW